MSTIPTPFDEKDIKEKFWREEKWDTNLPAPGFITDFVLSLRGVATPTSFCFWSAVFVVSNILQRDVYLKWFPDPMFANFFIIFVAPPKVCAKSTAVRYGEKLLYAYAKKLPPWLSFMKTPNITNNSTPEALNDLLKPAVAKVTQEGQVANLKRGSSATIIVSELANLLGKQKYNVGLTEKLIDLYDCKDKNRESTRSRGVEEQINTYVTMFAATTVEGLAESVPTVAMGGGFISRLIIDYHKRLTRKFPHPRPVLGGPSRKHLIERMIWIAENASGEYVFSTEANAYYEKRYNEITDVLSTESNLRKRDMNQRYDIHLVKLALLLRAQRYEIGNTIELSDIVQADKILAATFDINHEVTAEVGVSFYAKCYDRVVYLIKRGNKITHRQIAQGCSPYHFGGDLVERALNDINDTGDLKITLGGEERVKPSRAGNEVYRWRGKK